VRCSFVGAADERIEQAAAGSIGQIEAVSAERIAGGRRSLFAGACGCAVLVAVARTTYPGKPLAGVFVIPCEINSSTSSRVIPCSPSRRAASVFGCCRIAAQTSPPALPAAARLDVKHRGLQHAAESGRLFGLPFLARATGTIDSSRYAFRSRRSAADLRHTR
jgi:hypothetical protein